MAALGRSPRPSHLVAIRNGVRSAPEKPASSNSNNPAARPATARRIVGAACAPSWQTAISIMLWTTRRVREVFNPSDDVTNYADFRTALSTSVLPSDQIAPGTLWLEAITVSNAVSIQLQSSSVMVSGGNSFIVWLP